MQRSGRCTTSRRSEPGAFRRLLRTSMAATFRPSTGHGRSTGRLYERVSGDMQLRELWLRRALSARAFISGSGSRPTMLCPACSARALVSQKADLMMFTIEFIRIRAGDKAQATLDRVLQTAPDLDAVKVRAKSMFATLDMPQTPDALRILDEGGRELFVWTPGEGTPSAQGEPS